MTSSVEEPRIDSSFQLQRKKRTFQDKMTNQAIIHSTLLESKLSELPTVYYLLSIL